MPDRDQPLELLRELRDVGVSPPRAQVLHARVSSAIAEEIEREHHPRRGGLNGSSPGRSTAEHLGVHTGGSGSRDWPAVWCRWLVCWWWQLWSPCSSACMVRVRAALSRAMAR